MTELFGWDLIYKITEAELTKKEDVLTLLIHYILIRNDYRCIDMGDSRTLTGLETGSEMLPDKWNLANSYSLRYMRDEELFLLKAVPVDDNIVYNLLRVSTLAVTNVAFNAPNTVVAIRGPLPTMVPSKDEVMSKIIVDLVSPHTSKSSNLTTSETQTPTDPGRNLGPRAIPGPHIVPPQIDPFWRNPDNDPLRVGGRDLDPFGGARGGGMIFNPFDPRGGIPDPGAGILGGLPRGSIPPGARFDPFGPPGFGPRPRRPPDTDFYPGMFM